MAYIRGKYYTYSDGVKIHLPDEIPVDIFDELVVMRFAQLVEENKVIYAEKRAIKNNTGNIGCDALIKKHGGKTTLDMINDSIKKIKK